MTAATTSTDPLAEFRRHLPRHVTQTLNVTQAVVALVHAAVTNHGWTPRQLADECSRDLDDVVNAGAVVTDRLRKAATHPPVGRASKVPGAVRPFCTPDCKANQGWVLDDVTLRPLHRCPCRTAAPTGRTTA